MNKLTHEEIDIYEQGANDAIHKMLGAMILWYQQGLKHTEAFILQEALRNLRQYKAKEASDE